MELTLKKAADLARAAGEAADAIRLEPAKRVSIYEANPRSAIATHARIFADNLTAYEALVAAQYAIRDLIGEANSTTRIDALLTQRAMVEAKIKRLSKLVEASSDTDVDGAEISLAQIENLAERAKTAERVGYMETSVTVQVVDAATEARMRTMLTALKSRKSDLTDHIAGLNLNTRITLPESVVSTLRGAGLI